MASQYSCCSPKDCCTSQENVPLYVRTWISTMIGIDFVLVGTCIWSISWKYNKFNPWYGTIPDSVVQCFECNLAFATISIIFLTITLMLLKPNQEYICLKYMLTGFQAIFFLAVLVSSSIGTAYLNETLYSYSVSSSGTSSKCTMYWDQLFPKALDNFYQNPALLS